MHKVYAKTNDSLAKISSTGALDSDEFMVR